MFAFRRTYSKMLAPVLPAIIVIALFARVDRAKDEESMIPVLGDIQALTLLDHNGQRFDRDSLLGAVHVVNFLFTSCEATCPLLVRQMQDVERNTRDFGDDVRFLSITVDPETDTPAVLKAYGTKRGLDFARWSFLSGELPYVESAVMGAFRSAMGKREIARDVAAEAEGPTLFEITHGEHFVLVDRSARIRGFHTAKNAAEVEAIVSLVRRLADELAPSAEVAYGR